ncbi:ABC transporter permease [Microbacterium sp.]|uniref:ABC transporter permease n=1 Tax=Microbacterium sp. TaxID=51671 RepID=UPI003F9CF36F
MSEQNTAAPAPDTTLVVQSRSEETRMAAIIRTLLTRRELMLVVALIVLLIVMFSLSAAGVTNGPFNGRAMAGNLINVVPLAMLALAEMIVILTGRGSIDLSVGSMVSLVSMVFGFMYGVWGMPLWTSIIGAVVVGGLLGAVNGALVAFLGFPPLIATLATYYAYWSLAIVINDQQPISSPEIQELYDTARSIPIFGSGFPSIPAGVFLFLIPTVIVVWYLVNRAPLGRRLYAVGTNDVAAKWAGIDLVRTRFTAFVLSGAISGLVAVVTVGQFASARPDAGNAGSGMALPAITIAVLAGVAITGGIGKVSGVVIAALLVTWLNAGILLLFPGNHGTQFQLLALGVLLVGAALLNGYTNRKYHIIG